MKSLLLSVVLLAGCMVPEEGPMAPESAIAISDTVYIVERDTVAVDTLVMWDTLTFREITTVVDTFEITEWDTLTKVDTVRVIERDTVSIVQRDTVQVRDTILISDGPAGDMTGIWRAAYTGVHKVEVLMAVTPDLVIGGGEFTFSRTFNGTKTDSFKGRLKEPQGGLSIVSWTGTAAGEIVGSCTWAISFDGKDMILQEIGDGFFATKAPIRFTR